MAYVSSAAQLLHAAQCFQLLTPILHALAVFCTWPRSLNEKKIQHAVTWPAAGGRRTFVFQTLSWTLFAVSLLLALPPWYIPNFSYPLDLCMALATFSAGVSLLFMLKSILLFDPNDNEALHQGSLWHRIARSKDAVQWDVSCLPSKFSVFYIVLGLGLLWSVLGAALISVAQQHTNTALKIAYSAFGAACFTVAAFTTHGLGGPLRYRGIHRRERSRNGSGSIDFIARSSSRDGSGSGSSSPLPDSPRHHRRRTISFVSTETPEDDGCSSSPFHLSKIPFKITESWSEPNLSSIDGSNGGNGGNLATTSSLDNQQEQHGATWKFFQPFRGGTVFVATQAAGWLLYSVALALVLWGIGASTLGFMLGVQAYAVTIGGLSVYYAATGFGAEHTGKREWARFRNWVGTQAERMLPMLLGSFQVVAAPGAKFDRKKRYVFGYAPHGLFPIGAAYLPCTPAFKKIVNNAVDPCTLTASVVFQLPFLRDLLLWVGARVVNKSTFVKSLRERGSVMLVPGGQAELVEAYKAAKKKNPALVVCSRHKGFIRLAIQENAALVPVIVFGEVTSLRNAIVMPRLQRATYKLLGFPIPFLMAGKGGILPLPSKTGLRFVIGRPIEPSQVLESLLASCSSQEGSVKGASSDAGGREDGRCLEEEALVQAMHTEFYSQVQDLWESNKKDFPGYQSMPLVLE
ncbi:hypothetical protein Ndes2437B_g01601 [Nannochloris sp. 'desiccata']